MGCHISFVAMETILIDMNQRLPFSFSEWHNGGGLEADGFQLAQKLWHKAQMTLIEAKSSEYFPIPYIWCQKQNMKEWIVRKLDSIVN